MLGQRSNQSASKEYQQPGVKNELRNNIGYNHQRMYLIGRTMKWINLPASHRWHPDLCRRLESWVDGLCSGQEK